MNKILIVTMPDGSEWAIPVDVIAMHHATYFAKYYDGDVDVAMQKRTLPNFNHDNDLIVEWAEANMSWDDVKGLAIQVAPPTGRYYAEGWLDGYKTIRYVPVTR